MINVQAKYNLHSTMYLLNHIDEDALEKLVYKFTFHYVSIKSKKAQMLLSQN